MEATFLYLQKCAAGSGIVIGVVIALRYLLRDAPKAFRMVLWAIVAARLLCPYVPESPWSVIPESAWEFVSETASAPAAPAANIPEPVVVMTPLNPAELYPVPARDASAPAADVSPVRILSGVWLCGLCGLLAWSLYSYLKLRRVVAASLDMGGGAWICDDISAPFALGLIRPRIYVPSGLTESELSCVLAHERAHIRRGDTVWMLCAWLITCLHWFHPLVWLSYWLFRRDLEFACDEAAIRHMDASRRAAYSEALLQCGLGRRKLQVCPLAFGETGVKERVRAVLNYRNPALWLTCAAVCVCVVAAACLLTRPATADGDATETQSDAVTDDATQSDAVTDDATLSNAASVTESGKEPLEWVTVDGGANWTNLQETRESVEFPGLTFRWTPERVTMIDADGAESVLYDGMPVWNAYFADLNGDGCSELCSMISVGSGIVDERIEVYDVKAGKLSELNDRGYVNYTLELENGVLTAKQWRMGWYVLPYSAPLLTGTLRLTDAGKLLIVPSNPDAVGSAGSVSYALSPELESAVRDAILTHRRDAYAPADFDAESHVLLGMFPDAVETDGGAENVVTLYLMTLFEGYNYHDGRFEGVTGRSGPAVLTFRKGLDGSAPVLTEYWEPRDGSYYWPDVRGKFPASLSDADLDTQTYIMRETQDCYRQAVEHGNIDVTPILDALFAKIAESPAHSSNPGDYMNEHPIEVRELLYYGDYTRTYIRERVADAQGLLQYLMRLVLERLDALTWYQPGAVTDLSALGTLSHATLTHIHDYSGPEPQPGTYALSDAEKLSALRELLTGAEMLSGATKCPFEDVLTLTDESGATLQLALAADTCAVYRFAGRCYRFADDCAKLYALFT